MSIKKIAEKTGVSVSTVSRILNKPDYRCSVPGLREKVWSIAMEMNYVPNEAARNLKKGTQAKESKIWHIHVLMTRTDESRTDPFFTELLHIIESEIHEQNCILSKVWYKPFFSDDRKCRRENLDQIIQDMYTETEEKKDGLALLDERFLEKPSFAIAQAKKAAVEMAQDSVGALNKAIDLFKNYDKEKVKLVSELEDKVDHYEDELGTYLMKLSNADLSQKDSQTVSLLLHCIGDFERISDHACNLMDSAKEFHGKKEDFSDKAKEELNIYEKAIREIVSMTYQVFETESVELATQVEPLEEVIDTLNDEVKKKHVKRLRKGKCTIELGFILSDITTNYERIADHCSNIAVCLIQTKEDGYETHEYLDSLKANEDPEFTERYRYYRKKFKLP